jgi:hypothetical protein
MAEDRVQFGTAKEQAVRFRLSTDLWTNHWDLKIIELFHKEAADFWGPPRQFSGWGVEVE